MTCIVETRTGRLEGVVLPDKGMTVFRGIPFARPPVGERRFSAPLPASAWGGIRKADAFGAAAPQLDPKIDFAPGMKVKEQSEDCLYLNVFTPAVTPDSLLPVMVWIHGGAFTIGSGSQAMYNPVRIVGRGGVVVVTLNYRLGALGFLGLEALGAAATSNAGLLDQVLALEWVRDNIEVFGGDRERVTIFGESAGGMSVGSLLGMPAARGLFHAAIPMSGAAHSVASESEGARTMTRFCRAAGVAEGDLSALRKLSITDILAAQETCEALTRKTGEILPFRPAVSPGSMPEPAIDAIAAGLSRDVAVLAGCTRDEWLLFSILDPARHELTEAGLLDRVAARLPEAARNREQAESIVACYRETAPAGSDPSPARLHDWIETDRVFRIPAIRIAEAQSRHQKKTFQYLFTWESPMMDGKLGACHGIDVPFVFGSVGNPMASVFAGEGDAAIKLRDIVMDCWLGLARKGDPNAGSIAEWPRYEEERRHTMFLGPVCEVRSAPFDERRKVWEGIL